MTVVVPTMNVEDYLNEALESLSFQTLEEMEFICLNDGSTDHSLAIMKEYAFFDKRFIIIDKQNSGYGNSMNIGIDHATGEFLGILEPDDFVSVNMFRELYKIAHANKLDFIKADFYRFKIDSNGKLNKILNKLSNDNEVYNHIVSTSEDIETFRFIMNTWSGI